MNIFENFRASKLYVELVQELPESLREDFRRRMKKLFNDKVISDQELENYLLTPEEIQHEHDEFVKNELGN